MIRLTTFLCAVNLVLFATVSGKVIRRVQARPKDSSGKHSDSRASLKVAMLFRGESFRRFGARTPAIQWELRKHTCGDASVSGVSSLYSQQSWTAQHNQVAARMAELGIDVDIYGVTYPCANGLDYATRLPEMYVPKMKGFEILRYEGHRGDSQQKTMAHVLRMALKSGEKYDGFYILRWDYWYSSLANMNKASCFVDASPRQMTHFEGGNPDGLFYIPASYAEKFLAYLDLGAWGPEGIKAHGGINSCCPKCGCNRCVKKFLVWKGEIKEKDELTLDCKKPPCICSSPDDRKKPTAKHILHEHEMMQLDMFNNTHYEYTVDADGDPLAAGLSESSVEC